MPEETIFHIRKDPSILTQEKIGPLFNSERYKDIKDPCPVFDGKQFHIYGSGGDVRNEEWNILHAVSQRIEGPWEEQESIQLNGLTGTKVAAPGVVYDDNDRLFHMFLQTDFTTEHSSVVYLTSQEGKVFNKASTVLSSERDIGEIALYDPHPFTAHGEKYLVYSASTPSESAFVPKPDIFLAKSSTDSWGGPWIRLGKILDHDEIAEHHNRKDDPMYEWGIEGPQLVQLSNGDFLLNATCFLPHGPFGTRQRVFFALSSIIEGPYRTLGPVITDNLSEWESGENGHAAILKRDTKLYLFYQGRSKANPHAVDNDWRYGIAIFDEQNFLRNIETL